MENTMHHDMLTVSETAGLARLKPSTIRRWILDRKISYLKLGRRVFIRRQDLDALIAESLIPAKKRNGAVGEPAQAQVAANDGSGASSQPKNSPPPPTPLPQRE